MTDNKSAIFIAIVISLVVGWLVGNYILPISQSQPTPIPTPTTRAPISEPSASEKHVVQVTDTGFVPNTIRIKSGEVVTFLSKATAPVWPAGDVHPTHDKYPSPAYALAGDQAKSFGSKACVEYGIRKNGDVLDPCKMLLPNQTFSFQFNEKGNWGFHNHVRPEHSGVIIVE